MAGSKPKLAGGMALLINGQSRLVRKQPKYLKSLEKEFGDRGPFIASKSASELPNALADVSRAHPSILFI